MSGGIERRRRGSADSVRLAQNDGYEIPIFWVKYEGSAAIAGNSIDSRMVWAILEHRSINTIIEQTLRSQFYKACECDPDAIGDDGKLTEQYEEY